MMPTLPERVTNAIREIDLCRASGGELDVQRAAALEQQLHDTIAVLSDHGYLPRGDAADHLEVTYPAVYLWVGSSLQVVAQPEAK